MKIFCTNFEKVENFEKAAADNFDGWECHHRLETHTSDGELRDVFLSRAELIALDMYYNRPPEELVFMLRSDHARLHHKGKPHTKSKEWQDKITEARKGLKLGPQSEEHKAKRIAALKEWYKTHKRASPNKGNSYKMSEETKQKMRDSHKNMKWKLVDGKRVYYKEEK